MTTQGKSGNVVEERRAMVASVQSLAAPQEDDSVRGDPVFTWGVINETNNSDVGDCEQRDGTLTLLADGTASWSCFVLTYHTHSGDTWRSGFELRDANDVVLAESYFITGPDHMDDGNPPPVYPWNDVVRFTRAYDRFAVAKVNQSCKC